MLAFKGGFMDGEALDEDTFKSIARLPGREVLNGQFAGVVASPLTGLVRGLGSMIQGLALQLGQIAEQGLVSGEARPPMRRPRQRKSLPPSESAEESPADPDPSDSPEESSEEQAPEDEDADQGEAPETGEGDADIGEEPTSDQQPADETSAEASENSENKEERTRWQPRLQQRTGSRS